MIRFTFLCLIFSCTQVNDEFQPQYNKWYHYQTELFKVNKSDWILYHLTFRFDQPPKKNSFFLEVNSFNDERKSRDGKHILYQTQIYGEFELKKGKLFLKYTDSVVNHRYCDWVLSHINHFEEINFYFDKKRNQFSSNIKGKEKLFRARKKLSVNKRFQNHQEQFNKASCDFFKNLLGPQKGFFTR